MECGFVYLKYVPTYEAVSTEFAWDRTFVSEKARRAQLRWGKLDAATRWRTKIGHWIDRYRRDRSEGITGNVLDVGCGGDCQISPGPTPFGIEISPQLATSAAPQFEARAGKVINAPALHGLDAFADSFFDAMLMRSYLEHEAQAREVLTRARSKLKDQGVIYVRVPDFGGINRRIMGKQWCGFRFPDHVNYFSQSSLRALVERVGFQYNRINRLSLFDDNLIVELRKSK